MASPDTITKQLPALSLTEEKEEEEDGAPLQETLIDRLYSTNGGTTSKSPKVSSKDVPIEKNLSHLRRTVKVCALVFPWWCMRVPHSGGGHR